MTASKSVRSTEPAGQVNPTAAAATAEMGIDITANAPHCSHRAGRSSPATSSSRWADAPPLLPGAPYRNWKPPDPAGRPLDVVRMIRDDIADRVQALIAEPLAAKTIACATLRWCCRYVRSCLIFRVYGG